MTMKKLSEVFCTVTPCRCTASGSSGVACDSLFCTCTCATSASVPAVKVRVMLALPFEDELEDMYRMPSSPVICCSITWVTVLATVSAEAPG